MSKQYILKQPSSDVHFKVDYTKELNEQQLDVVTNGDGPCLVLAGAGSGKTRTIVYRVAYLLERGVRPENILLVTFTNKAAREMLYRIEELLKVHPKGLWGGTFHHVANLILRKYGKAIGYPQNFTILDDDDNKRLIELCRKDVIGSAPTERFPSKSVLQSIISLAANTQRSVADVIADARPEHSRHAQKIESIADAYTKRKHDNHQMDFDDLLVNLLDLLRHHPEIAKKLSVQFTYILVDEYQDTNTIQAAIVEKLSGTHGNLLVVGDDAQSIYSFRGADIENILTFPDRMTDAKLFRLETNYRSTKPILDLANEIISHNQEQFTKILHHVRKGGEKPQLVPTHSAGQEADVIAQMILEMNEEGTPMNEIVVLFRASYQSQELEFELTKRDIPYEYRGGVRFFERAHIKDVISYMKLIINPLDELALMRTLTMQVGIGPAAVGKMQDALKSIPDLPNGFIAPALKDAVPSRAQRGVLVFQGVMKKLLGADASDPADLIRVVTHSTGYRDYLFNEYPNAEERLQDLEQLARFGENYNNLTIFLAEVSLQESFAVETGREEHDQERIVLSTIHQAKGLEWDSVFIMSVVEPGFPNPRSANDPAAVEEERRLFYVAVTRAKQNLVVSYPLATDMRMSTGVMVRPSRFIAELDTKRFEQIQIVEELPTIEQEE